MVGMVTLAMQIELRSLNCSKWYQLVAQPNCIGRWADFQLLLAQGSPKEDHVRSSNKLKFNLALHYYHHDRYKMICRKLATHHDDIAEDSI